MTLFESNSWEIIDLYPKYVKYIPKKDLPAVGGIINGEIKRLAMLKSKPKEFAWLLNHVMGVIGHSSVVDGVIREGIRKLIAENPNNVYLKHYLGTV